MHFPAFCSPDVRFLTVIFRKDQKRFGPCAADSVSSEQVRKTGHTSKTVAIGLESYVKAAVETSDGLIAVEIRRISRGKKYVKCSRCRSIFLTIQGLLCSTAHL